jgi:hypothetical protein
MFTRTHLCDFYYNVSVIILGNNIAVNSLSQPLRALGI